jgi:hypothetical protein
VVQTWSDEQVVRKWKTINRLIHSRDGRTIQPVTDGQIKLELARPGRIDLVACLISGDANVACLISGLISLPCGECFQHP